MSPVCWWLYCVGLLLKGTVFQGNPVPFVMELPAYRLPSAQKRDAPYVGKGQGLCGQGIYNYLYGDYNCMGTSELQHTLSPSSPTVRTASWRQSARLIAPFFAPLGFGDWRAATALVTGLMAKETVVSTLAVLMNVGEPSMLVPVLSQLFTPLAAVSFLVFTLLYMPCVAAMAAVRRELGSVRGAVAAMAFQTGVAWVVAFLVYQVGMLLGF